MTPDVRSQQLTWCKSTLSNVSIGGVHTNVKSREALEHCEVVYSD